MPFVLGRRVEFQRSGVTRKTDLYVVSFDSSSNTSMPASSRVRAIPSAAVPIFSSPVLVATATTSKGAIRRRQPESVFVVRLLDRRRQCQLNHRSAIRPQRHEIIFLRT